MPDVSTDAGVARRLARIGRTLPAPPAPAASYATARSANGICHLAGQVPFVDGDLPVRGVLGRDLDVAEGREQAAVAALNALAVAADHLGDLETCVVLSATVYVASDPSFVEQHLVADGATELIRVALGDRGQAARAAIGVPVLPLGAPVEVQLVLVTGVG